MPHYIRSILVRLEDYLYLGGGFYKYGEWCVYGHESRYFRDKYGPPEEHMIPATSVPFGLSLLLSLRWTADGNGRVYIPRREVSKWSTKKRKRPL